MNRVAIERAHRAAAGEHVCCGGVDIPESPRRGHKMSCYVDGGKGQARLTVAGSSRDDDAPCNDGDPCTHDSLKDMMEGRR